MLFYHKYIPKIYATKKLQTYVYFVGQPRLHLVNQTHFSNFCERSDLGKTEFKLGRSWGFSNEALLWHWAGIPSCPVSEWTKNTQKPNFFEKRRKSSKTKKIKNVFRYAKISDMPFDQSSLIHREAWFPPCFIRQNQQKKKTFFCAAILDNFQTKMFKSETTSFHYFSPRIPNL